MTMGDTEVNYNMDEGLYPVLPGVKINFQSLGELAEHVGQCSSYETEHVNWKYFENQTHGKLLDLSPLPHSSNSTLFKYTALVQVEKSCFWSKKESTKIGYLTLILNVKTKLFTLYMLKYFLQNIINFWFRESSPIVIRLAK